MRTFCATIIMLRDSELQTRLSRDWSRYVSSWRCFVLWSSCYGTVKHKPASHAIDPDTFLHEEDLYFDHHAAGRGNTNSLFTRLIQIRFFMRMFYTMIIMPRDSETPTRCSTDWSRYVAPWGCSVLWSSCCRTVKHKLAGHAIDPDTYLHEDALCYDHHTAAQWNTNSLITRLIQIRSFMRDSVLWLSYCSTVKHKPAGHAIDPNTFLHEGVLCCDHHASGQWNTNPLITLLIQIRSFMRMFSTMIIIRLDSETQTRWPRDWSRYVLSWGALYYDHHAAAQWNTNSLTTRLIQIRSFVSSWGRSVLCLSPSCCGVFSATVKHKSAGYAIDPDTFFHEGVLCYDHHATGQ